MMNFIRIINENLHLKLQEIELEESNILDKASAAIRYLENIFEEIKIFIFNYTFNNKEEEIYFFKEIKPHLFCNLIYFRKVYNIETLRPAGSNSAIKEYYLKELNRIQSYFEKNIELYKYYRNGHTHFDNYYFLRGKPDIQLTVDSFYFERDPNFSTTYDFTISKILANDMLIVYINNEIVKLEKLNKVEQSISAFPKTKESWTRSKTDLVELIYALIETNSFNFGKMTYKRLTDYLENVFNIDLGDVYHTYLTIRGRNNRTQFLDELKANLISKMDKDDE
ncbi:RteC domain-containing protein [Petrimonas sp.]|uniref:RteC domain-containing protein n=1 Tax=Petrimonas sp. TaxID=2023866 RepID=UPI003F511A80